MFDLSTVWLIIIAVVIYWGFWQQRKFAERAERAAKEYCQRHRLQLLSVPMNNWQLRVKTGLVLTYTLNYSADGLSARKGEVVLVNGKVQQIYHMD